VPARVVNCLVRRSKGGSPNQTPKKKKKNQKPKKPTGVEVTTQLLLPQAQEGGQNVRTSENERVKGKKFCTLEGGRSCGSERGGITETLPRKSERGGDGEDKHHPCEKDKNPSPEVREVLQKAERKDHGKHVRKRRRPR